MPNASLKTTFGEIEEIIDDVETYFLNAENFSVLDFPPSDHHFSANSTTCSSFAPAIFKASLMRKIKEEWNKLNSQNPSRAYIRVYGSSKEVMRIALVAEEESSFHHGLFFFDLRFPRSFPSKPPRIFYHSFGESQYSNTLHSNGTVSLDLFDRWEELGFDDPSNPNCKKSAVLEILEAIRDSVTNPNYNNSVEVLDQINKKMYLTPRKTCGAMLRMIQAPPKGFEVFVAGYFRTRAHRILLNFRALVNVYAENSDMKVLFFRLVRAFEKNGTYCKHHYAQNQYDEALKEERACKSLINDVYI